MSESGVVFTESAGKRIVAAVRRVEGEMSPARQTPPVPGTAPFQFIEITGGEDKYGHYKANAVTFDVDTGLSDSLGQVRVRDVHGSPFRTGQVALGRFQGITNDDEGLFWTVFGSADQVGLVYYPGIVWTDAQVWKGPKTFRDNITIWDGEDGHGEVVIGYLGDPAITAYQSWTVGNTQAEMRVYDDGTGTDFYTKLQLGTSVMGSGAYLYWGLSPVNANELTQFLSLGVGNHLVATNNSFWANVDFGLSENVSSGGYGAVDPDGPGPGMRAFSVVRAETPPGGAPGYYQKRGIDFDFTNGLHPRVRGGIVWAAWDGVRNFAVGGIGGAAGVGYAGLALDVSPPTWSMSLSAGGALDEEALAVDGGTAPYSWASTSSDAGKATCSDDVAIDTLSDTLTVVPVAAGSCTITTVVTDSFGIIGRAVGTITVT